MKPLAVITGGKGALATALHQALTSAGWDVLAPGRESLDVREPQSIAAYFASLSRLDLLIQNAAIRRDGLLQHTTEEDWDAVVQTSLRGAWQCTQAALPLLRASGAGHIIHIGSHSARGAAGQSAYAAAKAGLEGLTRSLASSLGPDNIRVNTVLPGWMETPFTADVPAAATARALAAHHLGRFNTPAAAASFIVALTALPHTSGQVFQLDSRCQDS